MNNLHLHMDVYALLSRVARHYGCTYMYEKDMRRKVVDDVRLKNTRYEARLFLFFPYFRFFPFFAFLS